MNGEVVELGPNFISGGFVQTGDLLFRLDPIDYQLALRQAKAAAAKSSASLIESESRATIARREWDHFQEKGANIHPPQSTGPAQTATAEGQAALAASQADLAAALLNLERTEIRAPSTPESANDTWRLVNSSRRALKLLP